MRFKTGHFIGFRWVYGGDGTSSKTSAVIASYHHPRSITWRWALYWNKPFGFTWRFLSWHRYPNGYGSVTVTLPFLGSLSLSTQAHMFRQTNAA